MQIGYGVNQQNIARLYFAWGPGVKNIEDFKVIPEEIKSGNFRNDGVSICLQTHALERVLQGESEYNKYCNIFHPDNFKIKSTIYEIFGLPLNIDIDEFNKEYKGMTRDEYIHYINSSL
mgnify:CR=1 FL=1